MLSWHKSVGEMMLAWHDWSFGVAGLERCLRENLICLGLQGSLGQWRKAAASLLDVEEHVDTLATSL